jgi:hypothetical protein
LYVATVNDFVRTLIQVVKYYQYLKGERAGTGLGKEELLLRTAQCTIQRTKDPKVLNVAMAKLPGADLFYTVGWRGGVRHPKVESRCSS